MASLFRRKGSDIWRISWTDPRTGARRQASTKTSDDLEAQQIKADLEREIAALRKKHRGNGRRSTAATLAEFATRWLEHQRAEGNSASTMKNKAAVLRNHILPAFGHRPLNRITTEDAANYRIEKQAAGLSAKTVGNHLGVLHRMLVVAHEWGKIKQVPKMRLPRKQELLGKKIEFLEFDEADRYLHMVEDLNGATDHLYVLLAIRSGLRTGEMRALRWEQVRFDQGFVVVDRNITDASYEEAIEAGIVDDPGVHLPKWNKIRQVPLPWNVLDALKNAKARASSRLVFPGGLEGGFRSRSSIEKMVTRAAERGEFGKHVHPHMLRHTYASHLVLKGVNLKVVQELLGHASLEMTMRYAHLTVDHKSQAVQVLVPERGELRVLEGGGFDDVSEKV